MLKYKEIIDKMTLEEKASLCSGETYWDTKAIKRLKIPSIMMSDGPNGLRVQRGKTDELGINASEESTCFPAEATLCNSWNTNLAYKMGEALAEEALEEKVSILLAPGVNIKRSPLCGRNFEYFSEDPFLAGKMGTEYIKGLQSKGIGACLKHFACNNQEERRKTINTVVDERTLREIYLYAFEMIVKESKPWAVMSAYNKLNGVYCTENKYLLGILRDEWKHEGIVITDWGAENDRVDGLKAGNELEMPTTDGKTDEEIVEAVKEGTLAEEILDESIDRLLDIIFKCVENIKNDYKFDHENNNRLAQKIAEESIVLLKNEGNILPINTKEKLLFIGDMVKNPRFQGVGSAVTKPERIYNTYSTLENRNINFEYEQGYERNSSKKDKELLKRACDKAKSANIVIIYAGLTENYESEGIDRRNIEIPKNQVKLIEEVSKINQNVVVVLSGGSSIEMPWKNRVKAIVHGYLGGQCGAIAMVDVLFGKVNPSGKLSETYPIKLEDTPSYNNFPGTELSVEYKEGIYIGYRYYDKAKKDVLFPFGYGLSYTDFEYSNLRIDKNEIDIKSDTKINIKFNIKNIGNIAGGEVAQVYVSQNSPTIFKAEKELKGFEKVYLEPNEEKEINIILDKRAFEYYNIEKKDWAVESGEYDILVGKSSRDIVLSDKIKINSSDKNISKKYSEKYYNCDINNITDEEFEDLLGFKIPPREKVTKEITINDTLEQTKHTIIGGAIYNYQTKLKMKRYMKKQDISKATKIMMDMQKPLRNFASRKYGKYNTDMIEGFVKILNGNIIKGIKQINLGKAKKEEIIKKK